MESHELKAIRAELALSQAALADLLGVRTNTIWRWEHGERGIPEPAARLIQTLVKSAKRKRRSEKPP